MKVTHIWILSIAVILLLGGCASTSNYQISNSNLADLYRETGRVIQPEFQVFHVSDNQSELQFRLESTNLLYTKSENGGNFTARIKVTYMLFESYSSNRIMDSASVVVKDVNNDMVRKEIAGSILFDAKYPNMYVLKATVEDMNKGSNESKFISLDKTSRSGRQNFNVREESSGALILKRKFGSEQKLRVNYTDQMIKRLVVKYYDREFSLAPPPFAIYSPKRFDFTPDSMFYVSLDSTNSFVLSLNKEGMFHIQTDSASKEGLTLIRYENGFPDIRNATQIIEPVRFITTNKEYERISQAEFPRDGIEEYWLTVSSSPDRARELIRAYYNRVEDANRFFTTHIQGWKTDRGIIYVVFGPPDVIYKNAQGESWIYGNGKTQPSITYNFNLTFNPFSSNDLRLERNPEYKTYWYKAVDSWRQGRIYKY